MSKNERNTKHKILVAAQSLMQQKGCNGVTIDDVAAQAGVSKGHVTYYFATKKDLTIAALEANAVQRNAAYVALYAAKTLDSFFEQCIAMAASQKTTSCLLGTVSQESAGLDAELQHTCCALLNDWKGALTQTFQRIVPRAKNHEQLALFFLAQLQGVLLLGRAQQDSSLLVANLQTLHDMMQNLDT